MTLFPFVRPCHGLTLTEEALWSVTTANRWGTRRILHVTKHPLPAGLLRLSPTTANITDVPALVEIVRSLTEGGGANAIAVSLPDVCARSAVFEFASFPASKAEQEALIRWRFQQDFNIAPTQGRLGVQVYCRTRNVRWSRAASSEHPIRVLAALVQQDIIEQYEQACLDAGLIPVSIGVAGLDVFDLCRVAFEAEHAKRSIGDPPFPNEAVFLFLGGWGLTCLVLKESVPAFVRVKRIPLSGTFSPRKTGFDQEALPIDDGPKAEQQTMPSDRRRDDDQDAEPGWVERTSRMITNECVATLQYYFEQVPDPDRKGRHVPLYAVESFEGSHTLLPPLEHIQHLLEASTPDSPVLRLVSLSHECLSTTFRLPSSSTSFDRSALPAFAGVMVH